MVINDDGDVDKRDGDDGDGVFAMVVLAIIATEIYLSAAFMLISLL